MFPERYELALYIPENCILRGLNFASELQRTNGRRLLRKVVQALFKRCRVVNSPNSHYVNLSFLD
jgi:hypothetical protein